MKYAQSDLIVVLIRNRDVKYRMMVDDDDSFLMEAMLPLYAKMKLVKGEISDERRLLGFGWLTFEQAEGCMFNAWPF